MLDGEEQIIKGAISGESSAFGLLYGHYQPKIYRFVFLKVGRREEAEDLTHQVFLNAWHNIENYKYQGFPFSSWLYRIARNQVIDYYRSRKDTFPLETVDREIIAVDDPLVSLETKLAIEKVQRAVGNLKPDYQEIIILRFIDGLSVKETAEALEKSEGAVKLLQHRAVKALKKNI